MCERCRQLVLFKQLLIPIIDDFVVQVDAGGYMVVVVDKDGHALITDIAAIVDKETQESIANTVLRKAEEAIIEVIDHSEMEDLDRTKPFDPHKHRKQDPTPQDLDNLFGRKGDVS